VGSGAGLKERGKPRPLPGFKIRTVQPVVSLNTDMLTRPPPLTEKFK